MSNAAANIHIAQKQIDNYTLLLEHDKKQLAFYQGELKRLQAEAESKKIKPEDIVPGAVFRVMRRIPASGEVKPVYHTVVHTQYHKEQYRTEGNRFSLMGVDFQSYRFGGDAFKGIIPHGETAEAVAAFLNHREGGYEKVTHIGA